MSQFLSFWTLIQTALCQLAFVVRCACGSEDPGVVHVPCCNFAAHRQCLTYDAEVSCPYCGMDLQPMFHPQSSQGSCIVASFAPIRWRPNPKRPVTSHSSICRRRSCASHSFCGDVPGNRPRLGVVRCTMCPTAQSRQSLGRDRQAREASAGSGRPQHGCMCFSLPRPASWFVECQCRSNEDRSGYGSMLTRRLGEEERSCHSMEHQWNTGTTPGRPRTHKSST